MGIKKTVSIGLFSVLLLTIISGTLFAASTVPSIIQNPLATLDQWLPIVGVAMLVSFAFAAILYILGKFLNDQQISARGISEFGQSIGTAIFVVLSLGVLLFFGSFLATSNVVTGSLSTDMASICAGLVGTSGSQLSLLNGNPTAQICNFVTSQKAGNADTSTYLNYGLASSYIIIANLTNQAAVNMNGLYEYEGYVGFLSTLATDPGVCEPAPPAIAFATNCALNPYLPRWFSIDISSIPYAGYNMISAMTRPVETQAVFIFYMLLTQMVVYFILISIWPLLLAAGIIMRAIPFTRSAGGLLMGITLVVVIILPLVIIIEYNALGHGVNVNQIAGNAAQIQDNVIYGLRDPVCNGAIVPQCTKVSVNWGDGTSTLIPTSATKDILTHTYATTTTSTPYLITVDLTDMNGVQYSATQSITLPQTTVPIETNADPKFYLAKSTISGFTVSICPSGSVGVCNAYDSIVPNFYVFPNIQSVVNYNGCWPLGGNLYAEETADSLKMAAIGVGAGFSFSGFVSQIPLIDTSIARCSPPQAISTVFQMMSIYGLMSVVGFMLPLINILIIISAIKNVSYIFGGDTDIAGLGKLV